MSWKAVWRLLKTAATAWMSDNAPRLGAALSFYTVFAISPLFVIAIYVASLWASQDSVRMELFGQLAALVGERGASTIENALVASFPKDQGVLATGLAISTLLVTSTGLFVELQGALNTVFGVESKSGSGIGSFVKDRLLSFAMIVGIGFLLLVSLIVSATLAAFGKYLTGLVPGMDVVWMIVNALISFGVITLLFAMIFKILPDVHIAWRDVWIGAAITALLFTGGKFLLGMYLGKNTAVSAYGAAGSLVLILLWVYYSAQILFFGAEITQAYANQFGAGLRPKAHARWTPRAKMSSPKGPEAERDESADALPKDAPGQPGEAVVRVGVPRPPDAKS